MLEVVGLHVKYGDFHAVWDATFRVAEGETVALLGPNGAGKTSTLRAVQGLLPLAAGDVRYAGRSLASTSPAARVRVGMALVPEGRELFPLMRVAENLELGFVPGRGRTFADLEAEVYELFPVLRDRRRQLAGTLSGGEQQMLAIARALMASPSLLMLDEPSLGLAPRVVDALYEKLRLLKRRGLTLLVVEQHVHEVLAVAHRGYVMEAGRVVMEGSASDLLDSPHLRTTYLAV
ncbi:MAG: ABC transporter ATP-binding protein [Armatimonadota bacterium]|nr:ABC transporter ATP-binding protein [Armatimonadota bacterium]MDR5698075.1 ABC transporter ATP-binding protein [Armatimonadota bacterium]